MRRISLRHISVPVIAEKRVDLSSKPASTFVLDSFWRMVIALLFLLLNVPSGQAQPLNFFKNYFVTGDYAVGGVGLRGRGVLDTQTQAITQTAITNYATGVIPMSGVPANADILAAFLYWEEIAGTSTDPLALAVGTFRGFRITGTQIAAAGTLACWSSGGGNGTTGGAQNLLVFRADVLRFLPIPTDGTGRPTGQRLVNGTHSVSLPDSGAGGSQSPSSGNQAFLTEGASLVVVYRVPGALLRAVVIYDGGYTFSSANPLMSQTLAGFYQASATNPAARMTHIVGDGDANFQDTLTVNGSVPAGVSPTNAFQGALGFSWDNLTFGVSSIQGNDSSVTTRVVSSGGPNSVDCLSWGAIIFATNVQDTDGDGLLDVWETTSGLADPNGRVLPDIHALGADPAVKDIFVQVDYMCTALNAGHTDCAADPGKHSHRPSDSVLQTVSRAFSDAHGPVLHFVNGNAIPETACSPGPTQTCLFPDYPGTVGWKYGFRKIKVDHFDPARKDIFHYALFAHALALPKWLISDKTLVSISVSNGTATVTTGSPHGLAQGAPITVVGASAASNLNGNNTVSSVLTDTTFTISAPTSPNGTYWNWGLGVSNGRPKSTSGVSDLLGGDILITLGLWDNFTGTDFMQASTLMHELGHNLALRHGGAPLEPNCKPNYQSIMSYLYQVRGLLDTSGQPHVNYSGQQLAALNENSLDESVGLGVGNLPYLPRWYAPLTSSFLDQTLNTTPANKHCDGTPLNRDMNGIVTDPDTVRIDGTSLLASPLDWNGSGMSTPDHSVSQDANFSGAITSLNQGFIDWLNLDLQQIGSRRDPLGYSLDIGPNDDFAAVSDLGSGGGELGSGGGELGSGGGELGSGGGELGSGGGELGSGGGELGGELDFERAESLGNAPNALSATPTKQTIDLKWSAPNVGSVLQYQIWRATCPKGTTAATCILSPSIGPAQIGTWAPGQPLCDTSFNFCDGSAKANQLYVYLVTATVDGKKSGPSNQVKQSH